MPPFGMRGNLRFLAGGGDMGARIRAYDWSATPLGAPRRWPQPLRTALDICLNSSFPTALYWGPDLRLLYNDAWAPIPAQKHPWALGRPARTVWADIWDIIEPQFAQVIASGMGFSTYEQMLPMDRGGRIEETYWNYSFTPIRDEHGVIVGIFNQGHDVTAKVLVQQADQSEIERWRGLFEQAPGAVVVLRGPEHIFDIANPAYLELIGRRDIVGRRVMDVLPEAIGQGYIELLDHVYRTGETYVGASVPIVLRRTEGAAPESRLLDFVYQPIKRTTGEVTGIFVQATDVTERAQAAAALRASEERLRRLNQELERRVAKRTAELTDALTRLQTTFGRMRTAFETSFIYQGYMNTAERCSMRTPPLLKAFVRAPMRSSANHSGRRRGSPARRACPSVCATESSWPRAARPCGRPSRCTCRSASAHSTSSCGRSGTRLARSSASSPKRWM